MDAAECTQTAASPWEGGIPNQPRLRHFLTSGAVLCCAVLSRTWLCPTLCDPMDCPGCSVHVDSPGSNTGVGCYALLQGIFSSQGLNPVLLHCKQIRYHLSHQGSPILDGVNKNFLKQSLPSNIHCFATYPVLVQTGGNWEGRKMKGMGKVVFRSQRWWKCGKVLQCSEKNEA